MWHLQPLNLCRVIHQHPLSLVNPLQEQKMEEESIRIASSHEDDHKEECSSSIPSNPLASIKKNKNIICLECNKKIQKKVSKSKEESKV